MNRKYKIICNRNIPGLALNTARGKINCSNVIAVMFILSLIILIIACSKEPANPDYTNPFDPRNEQTGGDPFNLTANIANGGITLEWTIPAVDNLELYYLYRSELEESNYLILDSINTDSTSYVDRTVFNDHTYYYKLTALFTSGEESNINFAKSVKILAVGIPDRVPIAIFNARSDSNNYRIFYFDASASYDYEDGTNIEYRWDFESDGDWDTDWLIQDTISYEYAEEGGEFFVGLSVRDMSGYINETTLSITVTPVIKDIDGNVYKIVKIGDQWWMAENLKVTHYQNGDVIPHIAESTEWTKLSSGAYCIYDNDDNNFESYGLLYNWYTVSDRRKIAPEGWHVPTDKEWKILEAYIGMNPIEVDNTGNRGFDEGGKLKEEGTDHWNSPNTGATNEFKFSALPGGYRGSNDYGYNGYCTYFQTSTQYPDPRSCWIRRLNNDKSSIWRAGLLKSSGMSIRCIKD